MDIEKLMVGDWVYSTHHKKNIRLTPYDFFTHGHNEDGRQYLTPSSRPSVGLDLEPIKLTEEILEKNGFNTCEFYSELIIGEWRIMCDCHNISILHGDHIDLDVPIEYVHELQHALKLCRIEKKIIL